jgi:hypothetical protein
MRRRWTVFYLLFALAAAGGLGLVAWLNFERPPAFADLPEGWFDRPARGDPASWTAPGAGVLEVEADGPVRLHIVPAEAAEVRTRALPSGIEAQAIPGGLRLAAKVGGSNCPADAQGPIVEVQTPSDLIVRTRGPVSAAIGSVRTLMVSARGCAHFEVERVDAARLSLRGRSSAEFSNIARGLDAVVRGPGRVHVGRLNGVLDADLWGRGRVDVDSGFIARAQLFAKGPGHIHIRGEAGAVTAEARMTAKVRIAAARGLVSGAGDVEIGRPNAKISGF